MARNKSPVAKPRGHTSSFASTAERVAHETAAATRKAWLSSSNEDEEDFSGDKEMQKSTASPHHVDTPHEVDNGTVDDDFGVSDVPGFLRANQHHFATLPDPEDWHAIRFGNPGKEWTLNMSIEAAFIQFQLSDTPVQVIPRKVLRKTALTDLLRDVIDDLKSHFASESSRGHGHFADSSLVRTTREAAEKARDAYVSLESCERNRYDYEYFCVHPKVLACLPRHSKVLASGFASPDGEFDNATTEALTVCRCGELMYAGNSVVATQLAIFNGITTVDQLKIELWNLIKKGTEEPSSMDTVTNQHIDAFNTATAETTAGSVAPRPAMMGGASPSTSKPFIQCRN